MGANPFRLLFNQHMIHVTLWNTWQEFTTTGTISDVSLSDIEVWMSKATPDNKQTLLLQLLASKDPQIAESLFPGHTLQTLAPSIDKMVTSFEEPVFLNLARERVL